MHVDDVMAWEESGKGPRHVTSKSGQNWEHSQRSHPSENLVLKRHLLEVPVVSERPAPAIQVAHSLPGKSQTIY